MLKAIQSRLGILTLPLLVSFLAITPVRADDAAAKPAALPQLGFIAAKSLDSAAEFTKKIGLDLPPALTTQGIEQQFPFLGAGSLDTTRPIGIAVCGGADISSGQSMAFVFPVKPTAATLDALQKLGGTMMPNHPDTVLLGTVGLRRTADYLIFSPSADVAVSANADAIVDALKGPDLLVKMRVDFKTLRTALPDQYKAMFSFFEASATKDAASNTDKENAMMFVGPMLKTIDTIDQLDVGVESGEKGIRLAITGSPLKIATAVASANQPGMPESIVARVDLNLASTESTASIRRQIQKAFNTGATSDATLTEAQKKQLEEIGNQLGGLIFDADTTSAGEAIVDSAPVLYIVQHWSKPINAPKEWKRLLEESKAISSGKDADSVETYTQDDLPVTRVNVTMGSLVHIDVAQKENDVFITVAVTDPHYLHPLISARAGAPMKGVLSGWFDLGKGLEAIKKLPSSPLAGMSPEVQKQLDDWMRDQKITISTSADGDAGTLDVTITKGMLENIPKLMEILNGPAKPADAK